MDYSILEINSRESTYHVVKFYEVENKPLGSIYCVPSSWIKWQDNDSTTVLMAYPDEPHEITEKRVKNYETPNDNWTLFFAEIMYSSDLYNDAINYIAHKNAEKCSGEVSMEIESQCSVPNSSVNSDEDESAFLLKFEEEINRQLNSDPQSLVVNTIDEIINSKLEISEFEMDQDIYEFEEENHLNKPFMPLKKNRNVMTSRTSQNLGQRNNLLRAADNSRYTDEKWTLKHQVYSPGLVELTPNSGVYIEEAKLKDCLKYSKTCTSLTRRLTANIFTEYALRKCIYIGNRKGDQDNRLDRNAVREIVNFVREHEYKHNSRVVHIAMVESAIRYQMMACKKDYRFHAVNDFKI